MQKDNSSAALVLVLIIGGVFFMNTRSEINNCEAVKFLDNEIVALEFISIYADALSDGFESSASLLSDEDSIAAFHEALSTSSQKARIDAAASTVDPSLQEANEDGPETLQGRAIAISAGLEKVVKQLSYAKGSK